MTAERDRVETVDDFWEKWMPVDHPAITPTPEEKAEFMLDLERVIAARIRERAA